MRGSPADETALLSLRQIAPAGFLTQAFALDWSTRLHLMIRRGGTATLTPAEAHVSIRARFIGWGKEFPRMAPQIYPNNHFISSSHNPIASSD